MKEIDTKKEKRKIKNYIILLLLFVASCWLVLYLCQLYRINDAEKKKIPVIDGMIYEIYSEDLDHYVVDNPNTVIYMCTANDEDCRLFEKSFKKLLKNYDYSDQLVYLNLTDLNQEEFVDSFNERYNYKNKLKTKYPAFVLFEDGKVKAILQNSNKKMDIMKVKQFLEINKIGEE
ncbi:MAG: hypothetical protein IJ097_03315 [Bacilli bacterium]|nr:hypothetical protein [Bacilli bacterium]